MNVIVIRIKFQTDRLDQSWFRAGVTVNGAAAYGVDSLDEQKGRYLLREFLRSLCRVS